MIEVQTILGGIPNKELPGTAKKESLNLMQRFFLQWPVKSFEWCGIWVIHPQAPGQTPNSRNFTRFSGCLRDCATTTSKRWNPSNEKSFPWPLLDMSLVRDRFVGYGYVVYIFKAIKRNGYTHVKCIYHDTSCILHLYNACAYSVVGYVQANAFCWGCGGHSPHGIRKDLGVPGAGHGALGWERMVKMFGLFHIYDMIHTFMYIFHDIFAHIFLDRV